MIQKVSKGVPPLVKTQKQSSLVNNFSKVLPLPTPPPPPNQAVWAQCTRLGGVENGHHVSASRHPGVVDYATML